MSDSFPRKINVQTSYKPSNYVLGLIFVVNIKFPRATYHTIEPSTEELCFLISGLIMCAGGVHNLMLAAVSKPSIQSILQKRTSFLTRLLQRALRFILAENSFQFNVKTTYGYWAPKWQFLSLLFSWLR